VLTADENETQGPLLFLFRPFGLASLELPELFAVGENQVHVFVKGLELADERASVLENDAHSIVQMRRHFVTLAHRHLGGRKCGRTREKNGRESFYLLLQNKIERPEILFFLSKNFKQIE